MQHETAFAQNAKTSKSDGKTKDEKKEGHRDGKKHARDGAKRDDDKHRAVDIIPAMKTRRIAEPDKHNIAEPAKIEFARATKGEKRKQDYNTLVRMERQKPATAAAPAAPRADPQAAPAASAPVLPELPGPGNPDKTCTALFGNLDMFAWCARLL